MPAPATAQGASTVSGYAEPSKAVETFRDCPSCPDMLVVPAGSFTFGSSSEERRREGVPRAFADREVVNVKVTIRKPFAMGRFEVTRGQYARFVAATDRPDPPGCAVYNPKVQSFSGEQSGFSWRRPGFSQTDDHPAACISWQDAHDFAAWLAAETGKPYRLASEEEWEYAARGGTATTRYWGDSLEPLCELTNIMSTGTLEALGWPAAYSKRMICASRSAFTVPVGRYPANPFGLNDMLGNIFEWVQDCYSPTHEGAPTDGSARDQANCPQRLPKGGSFHSAHWLARPGFHGGPVPPQNHPVASGIRVVRDLD